MRLRPPTGRRRRFGSSWSPARLTEPASRTCARARLLDYEHDRALYEDETTGCRSIVVGDVPLHGAAGRVAGCLRGSAGSATRTTATCPIPIAKAFSSEISAEDDAQSSENVSVMTVKLFAEEEPLPGRRLDHLRRRGAQIQLVGDEDLRGERTTHYRTFVDVREQIRRAVEAAGWKPANVDRYVGQVAEGEDQIDIWVGIGRARAPSRNDDALRRRGASASRMAPASPRPITSTTGSSRRSSTPPPAAVVSSADFERLAKEELGQRLDPAAPSTCR